jgi:hypothetical protein
MWKKQYAGLGVQELRELHKLRVARGELPAKADRGGPFTRHESAPSWKASPRPAKLARQGLSHLERRRMDG